jgi:hypothetical protein
LLFQTPALDSQEELASKRLPSRTILALSDAAMGLRVRNATYRPIADITENLASKDLKSLVAHDMLIPQGEKRGRFYVASDSLKALRMKTRESRKVEDPFTEKPRRDPLLPGMDPFVS